MHNPKQSQSILPVVAITMGDPAGVGPELCLRALAEPTVLDECVPVVFGDADLLGRVAAVCDLAVLGQCGDRGRVDRRSASEWADGRRLQRH